MFKKNKYLIIGIIIIFIVAFILYSIINIEIDDLEINPFPKMTTEELNIPEITEGDTMDEIEKDLESLEVDQMEDIDSLEEEAEEL